MIAPRSSRLMAKINWPIPPPVCLADLAWWYAGHVVLSGHIEQLLVQQEELFDAARGGVHRNPAA